MNTPLQHEILAMEAVDTFHRAYKAEDDPYKHISFLGRGGSGFVDLVEHREKPGSTYARKLFPLHFSGQKRKDEIEKIRSEAQIIRKLNHCHIVNVVATYEWQRQFGIIMLPVAPTDLRTLLHEVDDMAEGPTRNKYLKWIQRYPGCLIRAMDYIHEMRVKHKDIKPSNLLVDGNKIYITDFGISKDMANAGTTGTYGAVGPYTPMYCAPEATNCAERRGSSVDIFSLGCVILELATVLVAPAGSLQRFKEYREDPISGSADYSNCPSKILQWIWHLWGHWSERLTLGGKYNDFVRFGVALPEIAFFMLDPNPRMRITTRQLVTMLGRYDMYYNSSINNKSCRSCRLPAGPRDLNLPLHSRVKDTDEIDYPENPDAALVIEVAPDWESAKRLWLASHMWW